MRNAQLEPGGVKSSVPSSLERPTRPMLRGRGLAETQAAEPLALVGPRWVALQGVGTGHRPPIAWHYRVTV
jgi:hypothetical protein